MIIETIGGTWRQIDGQWVVFFSKDLYAFPFAQVSKHFANGIDGGDSILDFYDAARALARRYEKRQWWKFW